MCVSLSVSFTFVYPIVVRQEEPIAQSETKSIRRIVEACVSVWLWWISVIYNLLNLALAEFEEIVGDCFARYVSLSKQIGGLVAEQAELVAKAIEEQRRFLQLCSESRKPDDGRLMAVLKPTSDLIAAIQVYCWFLQVSIL